MNFEKAKPLNLFRCQNCGGSGRNSNAKCKACSGMPLSYVARGRFFYWYYPITRYYLASEELKRKFNRIRKILVFLVGLNFWIWFGFLLYREIGRDAILGTSSNLIQVSNGSKLLFWFGVASFSYLYYRVLREKQHRGAVQHHDYDESKNQEENNPDVNNPERASSFSAKKRHNISEAFTDEALSTLAASYRFADTSNHQVVTVEHLFYSLLSCNRISNIFIRLGILSADIQKYVLEYLKSNVKTLDNSHREPSVSEDFEEILFQAYEKAYAAHQDYVSVTELVLACFDASPALQEMFYDLGINQQKLRNVVEWVRVRERLQRNYDKLRHAARHRSTKGMDKAMTAIATPYLNQFSEDVTLAAQFGATEQCVSREEEFAEIFRIIEGGGQNVLLVGQTGVGKRTIVNGVAELMVDEDVPERIKDKRLVRISVSSLLAGATPSQAVERLITLLGEVAHSGNIVLYINNIQELVGVSAGDGGTTLDVADSLAEYLSSGRFLTIATTTPEAYAQVISGSQLGKVFTQVEVKEVDANQAVQVLESKVGLIEYKQQVFFSYDALEKSVEFAKRFVHETCLPGSAIEVMTEAASLVRNKKGAHGLVSAEDIAVVVAEKTKIPLTTVSSDESSKLLQLEKAMHERVVGQDEAVELVANALRRARAQVRAENRPIANFLFLGPTGVGKTELAKTIAEVYFGGEERIVRLDMSEYQDRASIYRLIGAPHEKGTGILTEAVRRNPFALILLDELEKADKDVLNVFLQVMDDGRLTDSTGQVVDFTNVILIATSNAGTAYVTEQLHNGLGIDVIKDRLLHGELKDYFRPEFLNRFDGIVLFKPLAMEDIEKIVVLMIKHIAKDLDQKGIELVATKEAVEFFATTGFDPDFGARPLRRVLEEKLENKLAELILSGKIGRRSVVTIGEKGEMSVS
jgi:ATP-dependent Clp protease ATP-binding subunit ClpA